jgi:hypothetical protein
VRNHTALESGARAGGLFETDPVIVHGDHPVALTFIDAGSPTQVDPLRNRDLIALLRKLDHAVSLGWIGVTLRAPAECHGCRSSADEKPHHIRDVSPLRREWLNLPRSGERLPPSWARCPVACPRCDVMRVPAFAALVGLLALVVGCGGWSAGNGQTYSVAHVVAALQSAGEHLTIHRLDQKGCPPNLPDPPGALPGSVGCDQFFVTEEGKVTDDPSQVEDLPRAMLTRRGGYSPWVVFVYEDPDDAEQVAADGFTLLAQIRGIDFRFERKGNVVVMYEREEDAAGIRDWLGRL